MSARSAIRIELETLIEKALAVLGNIRRIVWLHAPCAHVPKHSMPI